MTPSEHVLFIYVRDDSSKELQIEEIQSFKSLQECKEASSLYDVRSNGKEVSLARCASGCPFSAQNEKDCEVAE